MNLKVQFPEEENQKVTFANSTKQLPTPESFPKLTHILANTWVKSSNEYMYILMLNKSLFITQSVPWPHEICGNIYRVPTVYKVIAWVLWENTKRLESILFASKSLQFYYQR